MLKILLVTALVLGLMAVGAWGLMVYKDQARLPAAPYSPQEPARQDVAVVYYSRSGHSEAVALEIARQWNARAVRIQADYPLSLAGQRRAGRDALDGTLPPIQVQETDLSAARRLFLVAPTWWFRPAPPLWTWVEQADLADKEVILVTTGNSRYKEAETAAFADRVRARQGIFLGHVFLRRGRIFWQVSREDLLRATREAVAPYQDLAPAD